MAANTLLLCELPCSLGYYSLALVTSDAIDANIYNRSCRVWVSGKPAIEECGWRRDERRLPDSATQSIRVIIIAKKSAAFMLPGAEMEA